MYFGRILLLVPFFRKVRALQRGVCLAWHGSDEDWTLHVPQTVVLYFFYTFHVGEVYSMMFAERFCGSLQESSVNHWITRKRLKIRPGTQFCPGQLCLWQRGRHHVDNACLAFHRGGFAPLSGPKVMHRGCLVRTWAGHVLWKCSSHYIYTSRGFIQGWYVHDNIFQHLLRLFWSWITVEISTRYLADMCFYHPMRI